jgi:hypothetical protein
MTEIAFLGYTPIYTGQTSDYIFQSPINVFSGETLIIFISAYDTNLTPLPPKDWFEITIITGTTGTLLAYYHQPSDTAIKPTWEFNGLSNKFNAGYAILLSGCTTKTSKLIDQKITKNNISGEVGTDGFNVMKNKNAMIQAVAIFNNTTTPYVNNSSWGSTPSLSWSDLISNTTGRKNFSSYYISQGCAISLNAPKSNYTNFTYTLSSNIENLAITISLSSNIKTNNVLNSMKGF